MILVPMLMFVILVALVVTARSARVVPERERLVIERLGRLFAVRGPGLVWLVPFVDQGPRVDLDQEVPEWRSMTYDRLAEEIARRRTPAVGRVPPPIG